MSAEISADYRRGFNDAIRKSILTISAMVQRGDDSRVMCARAWIIEEIRYLKPETPNVG
jgi:hypothetical protein